MGCVCGTRNTYDRVFNDYWKGVSIRTIKPDIFLEKIKNYRMKPLLTDINMKNKFLNDFFDTNYKAITKEMIYDYINTFKSEKNNFLISLLFLTIRDKDKAKRAFCDLDKFYEINSLVMKDNEMFIKKIKLGEILICYLHLISLFSVVYISTLSDDKQDCIAEMSDNFKKDYQYTLMNNWLEKYSELVSLDEFFENEYFQFIDDIAIREGLSCIYYEARQNSHIR
jgi:hypothetical protein